jgi:hypothetical protein
VNLITEGQLENVCPWEMRRAKLTAQLIISIGFSRFLDHTPTAINEVEHRRTPTGNAFLNVLKAHPVTTSGS